MKVKLLVIAAALLMFASLSFAQGFAAIVYSIDVPLNDQCTGGLPIVDGTVVTIYWDANGNGPDAADVPPTICDLPPDCPTGPAGTVNYNTFTFNGTDPNIGTGPGTFATTGAFVSAGAMPSPARYYLKVVLPCPPGFTGNVTWVSDVFVLLVGLQDVFIGGSNLTQWHCSSNCVPGTTCTPTADVSFPTNCVIPGPQTGCAPITLCANTGSSRMVCVGPLCTQDQNIAAGRKPHVSLTFGGPGCTTPGAGWTFDGSFTGPWVLQYVSGQWYYCQQISIGSGQEGCATLCFDQILAAEVSNVAIVPLDNAVKVSFSTVSATNLDRFEVRRDGNLVARIPAVNEPTEHPYSFVDNTALNGTTYHYELVMVDANQTATVVGTQSVTPSMMNALVTEYALHQNFPNPFNPTTSIRFDLVEKNFVSLKIYNANGQVVATVVNGERHAGVNVVNFDATNLTSGLYFYTVKVGNVYSATKKMLLVK